MSSEAITKNDLANILESITALDGKNMTEEQVDTFVDSLNVTGINAVDYIVDQGTIGIWTYRKWNSGIAECWGEYDKSVTGVSMTAPFSGYNFDLGTVAFPTGLFNAKPVCTVNGRKNGNYTCVSYSNPSSTGIAIEFQSSISGTATCEAHIHAKGTWK